jgi:drug/metabolite transporter (DMT)-like permease
MADKAISAFDIFLMTSLICFWGSSFVIVKLVLREGLSPIAIATFRFLIAGALFLTALFSKRTLNPQYTLLVDQKDVPIMLLLALTGVTFFFTVQYTGIQMASASIAAILVCLLSPILIAVLSARLFNEQLLKKQTMGTGVAALGTFAVVAGGTMGIEGSTRFLYGSLLLLATPVLWATYSLSGKRILEKYDPFLIVAYVNVLGGLLLVPFSLAENSFQQIVALNTSEWLGILYLALACSLLGYFIWFYVMKRVGATVTSSFLFAEPLVTVLFAVAFVGETLNAAIVAGAILIFAGVYLVTRSRSN